MTPPLPAASQSIMQSPPTFQPAPPPVAAPSMPGTQMASLPATGSAGFGSLLSSISSALAAGAQAEAQAAAQADAHWKQQYARTLGPDPSQIITEMPTELARLSTDVPSMIPGLQEEPLIPTEDELLASLFNRRGSMMG
jgi:hypothetical protein